MLKKNFKYVVLILVGMLLVTSLVGCKKEKKDTQKKVETSDINTFDTTEELSIILEKWIGDSRILNVEQAAENVLIVLTKQEENKNLYLFDMKKYELYSCVEDVELMDEFSVNFFDDLFVVDSELGTEYVFDDSYQLIEEVVFPVEYRDSMIKNWCYQPHAKRFIYNQFGAEELYELDCSTNQVNSLSINYESEELLEDREDIKSTESEQGVYFKTAYLDGDDYIDCICFFDLNDGSIIKWDYSQGDIYAYEDSLLRTNGGVVEPTQEVVLLNSKGQEKIIIDHPEEWGFSPTVSWDVKYIFIEKVTKRDTFDDKKMVLFDVNKKEEISEVMIRWDYEIQCFLDGGRSFVYSYYDDSLEKFQFYICETGSNVVKY